jgi:hypothetical protein
LPSFNSWRPFIRFASQKSPSRSFARVSKRKQPGDPQLQVELSEEQVLELQIDREALISVEDIGVEGAENISLAHDLMEEEAQLASPSSQHAELADGVKEIVTDRLLSVAEIVRRLLSGNMLIRPAKSVLLFYLNILMVNAEPERIFSVLKQIVTATRSSLSQAHIEQLMMIAMNSPDLSIFQKELLPLCIRFWMFLKNQATASQEERELFQKWSEFEWGEALSDFDREQEKQVEVNRLDEFRAARMHSGSHSQPSILDYATVPSHSSDTVSTLHMAQPAAVESRQACSYDEFDAVRPMESSSIGVDAVVSSSAASQARLSSATAAESQFVRTQRQLSGQVAW